MTLPLEEQFKYHPPQTASRIAKHKAVNQAALEFAKTCEVCLKDDKNDSSLKIKLDAIITQIQLARMLAN